MSTNTSFDSYGFAKAIAAHEGLAKGSKALSDAYKILDSYMGTIGIGKAPKAVLTHLDAPSEPPFAKPQKPATIPTYEDQTAKKGFSMSDFQIYRFGSATDGDASMKDVLGGKGANLAEMSKLGIPVPPGFTLPCALSVEYKNSLHGNSQSLVPEVFIAEVKAKVLDGLGYLKEQFKYAPLVSVRSGARVSMPGMMDTILNVGLTSGTIAEWKKRIGERAALDSYRRLIQMYSSVALGIEMRHFDAQLAGLKDEVGAASDSDLTVEQLNLLIVRYLDVVASNNLSFPDTLEAQVMGAVEAVFKSWDNQRAIEYRKINSIPDDWGTAVTVQAMVFGNMNDKSATGVLFSRDPSTGAAKIVGEYLVNAQGEDVVAGIRTPEPLDSMEKWNKKLKNDLWAYAVSLESHYKDMQDIEFTVQDGKLYLLQTRNAKRSARAAFKVAYDMVKSGLIEKSVAVSRVNAAQLITLLKPQIDHSFNVEPISVGIPAGGGIVQGVAVFSSFDAISCTQPCILVTEETDPDDIGGMNASVGILTATGGLTSHAAVVARGMDKTCVVGCTDLNVNNNSAKGFKAGDKITICGMTGRVWAGWVPVIEGGVFPEAKELVSWGASGDFAERLDLSTNPSDIEAAVLAASSDIIYVDTCMMEGTLLGGCMATLGAALLKNKSSTIIVDLAAADDYYAPPDVAFSSMFGESSKGNYSFAEKAQELAAWPEKVKARCVIKLPDNCPLVTKSFLKQSDFKVLGYVTTFADLLDISGPVNIKEQTIMKVFGSKEAYQKALELTGADKAAFKPLPNPAYWYQPLIGGA